MMNILTCIAYKSAPSTAPAHADVLFFLLIKVTSVTPVYTNI